MAALDWGLSHINTPLVDLAHMVERFSESDRHGIVAAYLDAVDLEFDTPEGAVELGLLAHQCFFVWWHSFIVARGWVQPDPYAQSIADRVVRISSDPSIR